MAAPRPARKDGVMSDRMEAPPRPSRAPVPRSQMPRMQVPGAPRRNRRRWAVAAAVTACWVVLWTVTRSLVAGTLVLLFLAALAVVTVLALRALGLTRDHPWVRQIATRPWRDGQEVLQLALRHLPEVFVVTPSGALLAPTSVELRLSPRDFGSLGERMDIGLVETSAAEVYEEQVAAHGARPAGPGPVEVSLISDPSVPEGRYQLRQGRPLGAGPNGFQQAGPSGFQPAGPNGFQPAGPNGFQPAGPSGFQPAAPSGFQSAPPRASYVPPDVQAAGPGSGSEVGVYPARAGLGAGRDAGWPFAHDGSTTSAPVSDSSATAATVSGGGLATVAEPARSMIPTLRLITGNRVSETRLSGARAGRGQVELSLPDVPTVSREHARFTYSDHQWWVANLGMNGMTLNGASVAGEQPLRDGDLIRWGTNEQAPGSRVEIS